MQALFSVCVFIKALPAFSSFPISFQAPREALAQCVLAELPQQVVSYFTFKNLQPPHDPTPS